MPFCVSAVTSAAAPPREDHCSEYGATHKSQRQHKCSWKDKLDVFFNVPRSLLSTTYSVHESVLAQGQ